MVGVGYPLVSSTWLNLLLQVFLSALLLHLLQMHVISFLAYFSFTGEGKFIVYEEISTGGFLVEFGGYITVFGDLEAEV